MALFADHPITAITRSRDHHASRRDDTRFVIRDNIEAGRELELDLGTLGVGSSQFPFNTVAVKVHETVGGKKLFEYRWRMSKMKSTILPAGLRSLTTVRSWQ